MKQGVFWARSAPHGGRIGVLRVAGGEFPTPLLFPVVCMVTGTTARGGGLWKYVLHAHPQGLMRRQLPLMSEVLHFLDFSVSSRAVKAWRQKTLREHYNAAHSSYLNYQAPLFLDSGGFRLLWNSHLDLAAYGITASPKSILELQRDFGGSIVATLDYPLPPGLARSEAKERMRKSRENAIAAAIELGKGGGGSPFLSIAVHGQNAEDIQRYVEMVFSDMNHDGLADVPFGIAVGSLVPLRGAQKHLAVVDMVHGAIQGIPEQYREITPVHVFGVTGNMIPLLAYLGVDTFDSSTYAQEARSLGYFDPQTHRSLPVLELEEWTCECVVCRGVGLPELQEALVADTKRAPLPNGLYKSKYYADIALHNLQMDFGILERTRAAVESDSLPEHLISHAQRFPSLYPALEKLANNDNRLKRLLSAKSVAIQQLKPSVIQQPVSLTHTPDDFNILLGDYSPPSEKSILLVIPCSGDKPYSISRTHRLVNERLSVALGDQAVLVHKVTLSGLYGPVPEEHENDEAVLQYNFRLDTHNQEQMRLVAERLAAYIERFKGCYVACLGYATSKAYRLTLELAAQSTPLLQVLPAKLKRRRLTEFFRRENLQELAETLITLAGKPNAR